MSKKNISFDIFPLTNFAIIFKIILVKLMKKIEINDKKEKDIIIIVSLIMFIMIIVIIAGIISVKMKIAKEVVTLTTTPKSKQEIEWFDNEPENYIDLNNIIEKNLENEVKEIIETEVVELEYETEYRNNNELPKGMVQVLQQGQDGKQELIIKKQYKGEKLILDEQIGRKIISASIDRIVEVGTSGYYNSHKIKNGDIVYATPYELDIRENNKKNAEVIIRVDQDSELEIKKKEKNWYYVRYNSYYGWVEADCVTYIIPESTQFNNDVTSYSKKELLANVNKNMKLNKPSGLTLEQFEKIFENESKDKNGIFKENARYFYYIEQSYGINGVFVAAIGIHESNWGTSKIATDKKNLFGYGAYDMSAYESAYSYNGYAAGIDMIARVLVKHYLNPKGTSIYNGETATGKYYNGSTLSEVNKKYATDKKWANSVYTWMEYLYNRL